MTKDELSALLHAVKRSHWNAEIGMRMFLGRNPHLTATPEMYGYAVGIGRTPFPSIKGLVEGPFPVFKERPFWDERLWNTNEQREWEAEMETL